MFTAGEAEDGERLDRAVGRLLPGMGLRGRRRLIEACGVEVDGRFRPPGFRLAAGQVVALKAEMEEACSCSPAREPGNAPARALGGPRVVKVGERFAALYKPAGRHSESLAGGEPGLDACLISLLGRGDARLVNRLDLPTSGILLAAFGQEAEEEFRGLEDAGQVRKEYSVLVQGRIGAPAVLRFALDTADRKKVRVLDHDSPDPLRWTEIEPLRHDPVQDRTLLRAVIRKGARHQIRAHLARHGHPIVGDGLYGPGGAERLHLHHARIDLPDFSAEDRAEWE